MKFSALEHTTVKTLKIPQLNGGVNMCDLPCNVSDSQMTDCNNVIFDEGVLKTRPGLNASADSVLTSAVSSDTAIKTFSMSGTKVLIDGEYYDIAVEESNDWISNVTCIIYFTSATAGVVYGGFINFARTSDDVFYEPENLLFYTGKPTNGGGIYALVTSRNRYNSTERNYDIYEINAAMNAWAKATDFSTPVVYINGRGASYEEAKSINQAFTGQPKSLESPNILSGQFRAYFTSDGYSSCFRLPFGGLSESSGMKVRIYSSPMVYSEWNVYPGESYATVTYYTVPVTLRIDRQLGLFDFSSSGSPYPIPMMDMYHENNISVTATKQTEIGIADAVSCKSCAISDGVIILSGGNAKGKIFCVPYESPLYFPEDAVTAAGGDDSSVNALLTDAGRVLAFKQGEIYSLTVKNGEPFSNYSLVADDTRIFRSSDKVDIKLLSDKVGCENKATVAVSGGSPVWLSPDGGVYTLKGSTVTEISDAVKPLIKALGSYRLESAFAVSSNGYYMLVTAKKALVALIGKKGPVCPKSGLSGALPDGVKWYVWSFDEDISLIGGMASNGKTAFLCQNGTVCYMAELSGVSDTVISNDGTQLVIENVKIPSSITTKHFDFGSFSSMKTADNIFLSVSSGGLLNVKVCSGEPKRIYLDLSGLECTSGTLEAVRLVPHMPPARTVYITLSSDDGLALGETMIYYREMN